MGQLRGRVTPKVTYAGSVVINRLSQLQGVNLALLGCRVAIVPVLTEQAIKGASLIEDSQVLIAIFSFSRIGKLRVTNPGSARTNPISYAVGGQGIIVPADITFLSGGTRKFVFLVAAQSAIALFPGCKATLINTKVTGTPVFSLGGLTR